MGASDLMVLELVAGTEHGWGCFVDDEGMIPARLQRAAAMAPMWARFFGRAEWFDFGSLGGQPPPQRPARRRLARRRAAQPPAARSRHGGELLGRR